jgi:hypothetical protein
VDRYKKEMSITNIEAMTFPAWPIVENVTENMSETATKPEIEAINTECYPEWPNHPSCYPANLSLGVSLKNGMSLFVRKLSKTFTEEWIFHLLSCPEFGRVIRVDFSPIVRMVQETLVEDIAFMNAFVHFTKPIPETTQWKLLLDKQIILNFPERRFYSQTGVEGVDWICIRENNSIDVPAWSNQNVHQITHRMIKLEKIVEEQQAQIARLQEKLNFSDWDIIEEGIFDREPLFDREPTFREPVVRIQHNKPVLRTEPIPVPVPIPLHLAPPLHSIPVNLVPLPVVPLPVVPLPVVPLPVVPLPVVPLPVAPCLSNEDISYGSDFPPIGAV